ncbi:MAG: metallophosphoesterase [Clostridia bacterium]|nr:metallophosphoesterase [Clostridia bacterium]
MKFRKIISWIVTAAIVTANAVIVSVPTVSAEMVDTETVYREEFEYDAANYSDTLRKLKDYGWYMADNDTLYSTVDTVAPYSTYQYKLAKIVKKDGNMCLQVVSAGQTNSAAGTGEKFDNIPNYGYGKTFPGVEAGGAATGSWEINFDFKPYVSSANNYTTQFAFTLNTGDGSASSETAAQHNIIAGYGQRFYLGYRDYKKLVNTSIKPDTIKAAEVGGETWYSVKTILNCDAHYYSVEFYNRDTGKLIARRSPISFDADETIGFIKFSAVGLKQDSWVYIDNVSIEKIAENGTIYNETFDTYTNGSYAAQEGMTTGEKAEDFKGTSYFEGNTPWRFHTDIGNSYALENDEALSSQVVRLGDKPETADTQEASGLVYMPANEMLVNQTIQALRGKFKTSFKIKPETIIDDVTLNVIPAVNYDITNDDYAIFKIINDEGTPKLLKGHDYVALDASQWYNADVTFDVIERSVTTIVKDMEGHTVASGLVTGNATPYAVKGLMFKAAGGSSVLVDDINLEYLTVTPSVDESKIALTDRFGKKVTDINSVTTALKTVEIPMGCTIDGKTATSDTILLKDSNENTVSYTGSVSGNTYIMELESVLRLNEEYTVTIPPTVANTSGKVMGEEATFTFKTLKNIVEISSVNVNETPFSSLSGIADGSTLSVVLSYANDTDEDVNSTVALALYSEGKLVNMQSANYKINAGASGVDEKTVAFTVPAAIDMDTVDRMSVFIWDAAKHLSPLSRNVDVKRRSGEAGKYKDYVDFEVNVEGRDAVVLQLTDPQIIDATQVREGVAFAQQKRDFWLPELMNKRLFNDMRSLIEKVNPDLILLTGDLVYGGYDDAGTSFTKLADFLDGFGIPWAPVFGNHDNESKKGVDWQCEYLENCKNCLFKQRTLTGNGNYSIGIVQDGELKRVIFMLDSNGCGKMSDESFENGHSKKTGGFGDDQIAWYTGAAEKINSKFDDIKYTFAFHIQLAVFADAFASYGFANNAETVSEDNQDFASPINIDEREDKKDTDFGYIGRKLKTPWDNDKTVYNGMKALGADSILVGHEHCNSASVIYDGVRFQYGQKIGEYDRINFRTDEGKIVGFIAIETSKGTPVLGGTVMKLSESTGEISDAYIEYCKK